MFKNPIKVKSNTHTKASQRKHFKDLLLKTFPALSQDQINDLMNKKETVHCLKIATSDNNVTLQVLTVKNRPIIFDLNGKIFPTVFLLWRFPELLHSLTTHDQVMKSITSGCDLMLPDVVTPPNQSGLPKYGNISEDDAVSVSLTSNMAAIAVGVASQSSNTMQISDGKGKCVSIYHFYGDNLCTLEGTSLPHIPQLGAPQWLTFVDDDCSNSKPKSLRQHHDNKSQNKRMHSDSLTGKHVSDKDNEMKSEETDVKENMDELLIFCFLGALKYCTSLTLPVLISNFFKLYMVPICPTNKTLDIKKTSFKKLKPFLDKMSSDGIITVEEIKKGVEAITLINKNHPMFVDFYLDPESRPKEQFEIESEYKSHVISHVVESYRVTQNVLVLFGSGVKEGDVIKPSDIRKHVRNYVKDNGLQYENNPLLIKPRKAINRICNSENLVTWEEVFEKVYYYMKNPFVEKFKHDLFNKEKVTPIIISAPDQSGIKRATYINNLELFGIDLDEFSRECQHQCNASVKILSGEKSDGLLIEANEVVFVHNLLKEKYKIFNKHIKVNGNIHERKKFFRRK